MFINKEHISTGIKVSKKPIRTIPIISKGIINFIKRRLRLVLLLINDIIIFPQIAIVGTEAKSVPV